MAEDLVGKLTGLAKECRKIVVEMLFNAQSGHLGGSLSLVDILVALYFHELRFNVEDLDNPDRDRLILSKGHGVPPIYAIFAMKGLYKMAELNKFRELNSFLKGVPHPKTLGFEFPAGSLGNGLGAGLGMALAGKLDKKDYKVFVILGDGELDEGSIWEAAMCAGKYNAENLIAIVDRNRFQLLDETEKIMKLEPLKEKWLSFGWHCEVINGNSIEEILSVFENIKKVKGKPKVIIAETVKGKGVSYAEGNNYYHGRQPENLEQFKTALRDIENA